MGVGDGKATQKPLSPDEISAGRGAFQIMWRGPDGRLYVHQMQGDVQSVALNTPEGKHLREKLFWHLKAAFVSMVAAVYDLPPVEMEPEPQNPSPILNPAGRPYNSSGGGGNPHSH